MNDKIPDEVIRDWIKRHDLGALSLTDARAAYEDAATGGMHLLMFREPKPSPENRA